MATVVGEDGSLSLYADDRDSPIVYSGELDGDKVVAWALRQLDEVIAVRSE